MIVSGDSVPRTPCKLFEKSLTKNFIISAVPDFIEDNDMNFIIPVFIVALMIYFVSKFKNSDKSEKIPISKQILYTLLCFSPYLIFFVIIMIIAIILR